MADDGARLLAAARSGQVDEVRRLLELGVDTTVDENGTAMHWAAFKGHNAVLAEMLRQGVPVGVTDGRGRQPLHDAAEQGNAMAVGILLDAGALVEACSADGSTALHCASQSGRGPCVRLLLVKGARADVQNHRGRTALHWAAVRGFSVVVGILLEAGADPGVADRAAELPIELAKLGGHSETAALLLRAQAGAAPLGASLGVVRAPRGPSTFQAVLEGDGGDNGAVEAKGTKVTLRLQPQSLQVTLENSEAPHLLFDWSYTRLDRWGGDGSLFRLEVFGTAHSGIDVFTFRLCGGVHADAVCASLDDHVASMMPQTSPPQAPEPTAAPRGPPREVAAPREPPREVAPCFCTACTVASSKCTAAKLATRQCKAAEYGYEDRLYRLGASEQQLALDELQKRKRLQYTLENERGQELQLWGSELQTAFADRSELRAMLADSRSRAQQVAQAYRSLRGTYEEEHREYALTKRRGDIALRVEEEQQATKLRNLEREQEDRTRHVERSVQQRHLHDMQTVQGEMDREEDDALRMQHAYLSQRERYAARMLETRKHDVARAELTEVGRAPRRPFAACLASSSLFCRQLPPNNS